MFDLQNDHGMWFNLIKLETWKQGKFVKYVKDAKLSHGLLIVKC